MMNRFPSPEEFAALAERVAKRRATEPPRPAVQLQPTASPAPAAGGGRTKATARPTCRHLGDHLGSVQCPSCCGTVQVKTFACELFSVCTMGKDVGLACCATCKSYEPPETP